MSRGETGSKRLEEEWAMRRKSIYDGREVEKEQPTPLTKKTSTQLCSSGSSSEISLVGPVEDSGQGPTRWPLENKNDN